jgi:hypothetical protein
MSGTTQNNDLSPDSFAPVATINSNATGALQYEDAEAGNFSRRFYRLTFPLSDL